MWPGGAGRYSAHVRHGQIKGRGERKYSQRCRQDYNRKIIYRKGEIGNTTIGGGGCVVLVHNQKTQVGDTFIRPP